MATYPQDTSPRMPGRAELDEIDLLATDLAGALNHLNTVMRGVTGYRPDDPVAGRSHLPPVEREEIVAAEEAYRQRLASLKLTREQVESFGMFVLNMKALLDRLAREVDELEQAASPLFYGHYYDFMARVRKATA